MMGLREVAVAIHRRIDARWKQILAYHYSAWLLLLAGALQGLAAVMPLLGVYVPDRYFIIATAVVVALAYVSKIIVQKDRD